MREPVHLIAVLIRARRSDDRVAATAALTRLRQLGFRLTFGDTIPPLRNPKYPARATAG